LGPVKADVFDNRLQSVIQASVNGSSPAVGASLELVGLNEVRVSLGAAWNTVRDRVQQVAELELQREMGSNDFCCAYNVSTYLICFVGLPEAEVERKMSHVSQRVRDAVMREFPFIFDRIKPAHFAAGLDGETLTRGHSRVVDQLFEHLRAIKTKSERVAADVVPRLVERSRIVFSPSWSTSKDVVAFNRCTLERRLPVDHSTVQDNLHGETLADLDFLILSRAASTLHGLMRVGRGAPLLIPVHYQTLSNSTSRMGYLRLIEAIHKGYRHLIALQIVDIHASQQPQAVLEVVQHLSLWIKWVSLTFDLSDPRIAECAQAPVWALATDLNRARSTDGLLHSKLQRFQAIASGACLNTFAHGVNSIGLALAGAKAGITYLDGSAIHPVAHTPRTVGPLKPMLSAISSSRIVKRSKA
jgi:hypothetical protein